MNQLEEVFLQELGDIYSAETQLIKALPKMAKAAQSEELKDAFSAHLGETENHVERLKQIFEMFGKTAKTVKCKGMEGLIDEGKEVISKHEDTTGLDAAIICAAQKAEHYEIATYGTLCTYAELLGLRDAKRLLGQNLEEEKRTDAKLTQLAESVINLEAADAD